MPCFVSVVRRSAGLGRLLVVIMEGCDLKASDANGNSGHACQAQVVFNLFPIINIPKFFIIFPRTGDFFIMISYLSDMHLRIQAIYIFNTYIF